MKQSKSTTSGWSAWQALPLALIAIAGGALFAGFPEKPGLHAAEPVTADADSDGLVDAQEKVLFTSSSQADSDQDGWRDVEEFARQTSPLFAQSHPTAEQMQIGMSAHGTGGLLHIVIGLYVADQDVRSKKIAVGMMVHGRMIPIPTEVWMHTAHLSILQGQSSVSQIALIDFLVDEQWVDAQRDVSFFVTASVGGSGQVSAAASIHLKSIEGMVVLVTPDPTVLTMNMATLSGGNGSGGSGDSGGIYVPLPVNDDGDWPSGWTPGQICFQTTSTVGTQGASITQQVTSSSCQSGLEGACPASCSGSVGSTFTTVDPVVLIGG